jgi:hypothetical protein
MTGGIMMSIERIMTVLGTTRIHPSITVDKTDIRRGEEEIDEEHQNSSLHIGSICRFRSRRNGWRCYSGAALCLLLELATAVDVMAVDSLEP